MKNPKYAQSLCVWFFCANKTIEQSKTKMCAVTRLLRFFFIAVMLCQTVASKCSKMAGKYIEKPKYAQSLYVWFFLRKQNYRTVKNQNVRSHSAGKVISRCLKIGRIEHTVNAHVAQKIGRMEHTLNAHVAARCNGTAVPNRMYTYMAAREKKQIARAKFWVSHNHCTWH